MVPVDEFERFLVYWTVSLSQMFAKLKDRRNGQTDGWPNGLSSRRLIMKQINLNGKIKLIRCFVLEIFISISFFVSERRKIHRSVLPVQRA